MLADANGMYAVSSCNFQELARVIKPGGKLFFVDSLQLGDGENYNIANIDSMIR